MNRVYPATLFRVLRCPHRSPIVQTDYAVTALSILRGFGLEDLTQELLAGDGVHGLGNLLSLQIDAHSNFDSLILWLEGTDKVCCP